MSPTDRNAFAWLVVITFCALLFTLGGCTTLESKWNGCETGRWRGWDAAAACDRILTEKHAKETGRDRK